MNQPKERKTVLYFAYGSNMDWAQMRERCPSATFVGVARLADHRLAFTRKSVNRCCGVADVVPEQGGSVWGVVYQVPELEVGSLDKSEGYRPGRDKNSYSRRQCMVFLDGNENRPLTVETYCAERQPNPPLPNQAYKDLILSGARFWRLPADYIAELEAIEVDG
jgi:cation transport regulator ChaC